MRLLLVASLAAVLAACSHAECAIDTDCPLASYCAVDTHACVVIGSDAGAHDAGVADGAAHDGSSDGASDAHADTGPPDMGDGHTRTGTVLATSAADGSRTDVSVSFDDRATATCTTRMDGPCSVTECPAGAAAPTHQASGTVSLVNGTHVASLMPQPDMTYMAAAAMPALWTGGQMVDVASSGGAIPAFHVTLAGPGATTLTAPSVPATPATFAIVRSTDLSLMWTPGSPMATGAQLLVFLSWTDGTTGGAATTLVCAYDVTAHTGTLPATAMSAFPMGMNGTYAFAVATQTSTSAGGYSVGVTLANFTTMPGTGGPATGAVMFM